MSLQKSVGAGLFGLTTSQSCSLHNRRSIVAGGSFSRKDRTSARQRRLSEQYYVTHAVEWSGYNSTFQPGGLAVFPTQ